MQSQPHIGHIRSGGRTSTCCGAGCEPPATRYVHPQHHRHRRQDAGQRRPSRAAAGTSWPTRTSASCSRVRRRSAACRRRYEPRATGHVPEMLELIATLVERRPRLRGRGRLGRRLLRRAVVAGVRRALGPAARRHAGRRGRADPGASATRATSRSGRAHKPDEPDDGDVALAVGPGPAGLAHRVLGDGRRVPRAPSSTSTAAGSTWLPAPRERAGPVAGGRATVRPVLGAPRAAQPRRLQDGEVGRQLRPAVREVVERVRPVELRYYLVAPHYRSIIDYSDEALREAATAYRADRGIRPARGDRAWPAGSRRRRRSRAPSFVEAMDDDLNTSAALAVVHDASARATSSLAAGPTRALARRPPPYARCSTCSGSTRWPGLGQRVHRPRTAHRGRRLAGRRRSSSSARRRARARTSPRPTRSATSSRQPASRSRTPPPGRRGTRFRKPADGGQQQRRGAIKKSGKGNPTAGSGGRVKRGWRAAARRPRPRSGRTTRSTRNARRPSGPMPRAPSARSSAARPSGSRGGTRSSRHAGRGARHRALRRRGHRARRPNAGDVRLSADARLALMEMGGSSWTG